jgi:hypothetical protein
VPINTSRMFTTLGKLVGGLNDVNTYRGTTLKSRTDTVFAQFTTPFPDVPSQLYQTFGSAQLSQDNYIQYLQSLAQQEIIREVVAFRPLIPQSIGPCVQAVQTQMVSVGTAVEYSPASIAITPALVDGDAKLIGTAMLPDGSTANMALPDSILVTVPRGYTNGDAPYSESILLSGLTPSVPPTRWDWPGGSGIQSSIQSTDPALDKGLVNGSLSKGFTGWTTDPTVTLVAAVVDNPRVESTATVVSITNSTGGALPGRIVQTMTNLKGGQLYTWTIKVKRTTNSASYTFNGVLVSSTLGTLVTLTSTASSALTLSTWVQLSGFFVTPVNMGVGTISLKFGSASLPASESYELCHVGLAGVSPLYTGGPSVVAWSGTKPLTSNDGWSIGVTIGGTGALQRGIDRLIGLRQLLPSGFPAVVASTPATYPDSLVS